MSIIIHAHCKECGKGLHYEALSRTTNGIKRVPQNFRSFNDGKILRYLECCDKMGIKDYSKFKIGVPK